MAKKKSKVMLSSYTIIMILIIFLAILSHVLPDATFVDGNIVNGSGTVGATLSQVLMAPILGFENAVDVAIFIMILGGFLKIIDKTKALEDISFSIEQGEFCVIAGSNGSGKSVLMSLIAGLDEPTGGTIDLFGNSAGLVFQDADSQILGETPEEGMISHIFGHL